MAPLWRCWSGLRQFLGLTLVLVTTAACQSIWPTPQPPTPTPILLPRDVPPTPTVARITQLPRATLSSTAAAQLIETPPAPSQPTVTTTVRLMAVGRSTSISLRSRPVAGAPVVARLAGSAVLWVEGRTADSRWLWVEYGDAAARAWAAAGDLQVFGDTAALAVVEGTGDGGQATEEEAVVAARATPAARPSSVSRPPSITGKIAFQTSSGGDIYLIDANGANLRRVTDGIDPALSPDGTQLAFARWAAPHGIFVIDLATGAERRVASADRPRGPTWQADGSTLAFVTVYREVTCRDTPFGCLSDEALRARFRGQECIQTPVGRFCISQFRTRQIAETGLVQVTANGENRLDLPALTDAQSPAWNPVRNQLLYRGGEGLQVTVAGGVTEPVLREPALNSPAWSPDGSRIAVQMKLHNNTDLFLLDAAGHQIARLTAPATAIGTPPDNVAPTWSPDGRYLLFLSNRDGAWRLYRMNANGSNPVLFAPDVLGSLTFRYDFAAERVASWSR